MAAAHAEDAPAAEDEAPEETAADDAADDDSEDEDEDEEDESEAGEEKEVQLGFAEPCDPQLLTAPYFPSKIGGLPVRPVALLLHRSQPSYDVHTHQGMVVVARTAHSGDACLRILPGAAHLPSAGVVCKCPSIPRTAWLPCERLLPDSHTHTMLGI